MYNRFKHFFAFSHSEAKGAILLMVAMGAAWASPFIYRPFLEVEYEHLTQDQQTLDSMVTLLEANMVKAPAIIEKTPLAPFNPNTASAKTLEQAGLPAYIAQRVIKYRNSGGYFASAEDMKKIYGLNEKFYDKIQPWIEIPEKVRPFSEKKPKSVIRQVQRIDINQADTTQLKNLRGIGKVLSARIVKYRSLLGGYHSTAQLKEVYGISDQALQSLNKYGFVSDDFTPEPILINTGEVKELLRHPYLDYEKALNIVKHRQRYGLFSDIHQLKEVTGIDQDTFSKLKPYIAI